MSNDVCTVWVVYTDCVWVSNELVLGVQKRRVLVFQNCNRTLELLRMISNTTMEVFVLRQSRACFKQTTVFWTEALSLLSKACCNSSEMFAKICSYKSCQKCESKMFVFLMDHIKFFAQVERRNGLQVWVVVRKIYYGPMLLMPSSSHLSSAWGFARHSATVYSSS